MFCVTRHNSMTTEGTIEEALVRKMAPNTQAYGSQRAVAMVTEQHTKAIAFLAQIIHDSELANESDLQTLLDIL